MRVALCLYGLVGGDQGKGGLGSSDRTLRTGHKHYIKHLIDVNDKVDVFVHTWTVEQQDQIKKLYSPKLSVFEKQINFKIPSYVRGDQQRKNNHYSKWYSTKKSIDLKKKYEDQHGIRYDFVIATRFDIALMTDFKFNQFDPHKFYVGHWCEILDKKGKDVFKGGRGPLDELLKKGKKISSFKHSHKGYPHTEEGFIDQWFFSGSEEMDRFASLFDHLDEYTKPGKCPNDSAGTISNHRLSLYHLQQLNMIDQLDFAFHLYDDFPLIRRRFLGCKL